MKTTKIFFFSFFCTCVSRPLTASLSAKNPSATPVMSASGTNRLKQAAAPCLPAEPELLFDKQKSTSVLQGYLKENDAKLPEELNMLIVGYVSETVVQVVLRNCYARIAKPVRSPESVLPDVRNRMRFLLDVFILCNDHTCAIAERIHPEQRIVYFAHLMRYMDPRDPLLTEKDLYHILDNFSVNLAKIGRELSYYSSEIRQFKADIKPFEVLLELFGNEKHEAACDLKQFGISPQDLAASKKVFFAFTQEKNTSTSEIVKKDLLAFCKRHNTGLLDENVSPDFELWGSYAYS